MIIGHLATGPENTLKPGDMVTPDTIVGIVSKQQEHVHIEFWDANDPLTLRSPYSYMSTEVKHQFLALMANMNESDNRITFHDRSDGLWQSVYDQPSLLYGKKNKNLNEGQPGYENPWD